ncbi:hypothetical protein ACWCPX_42365 [Streptomyces olivaceoviridis]
MNDEAAASLRFILPGEVPDRETAEGWTTWRKTRHEFVPAPRISRTAYDSKTTTFTGGPPTPTCRYWTPR